jgi:hypothetical protein
MTNYRWGGYLLTAMGLINLRYHTGHPNNLLHSSIISIPGLLLLFATWTKPLHSFLVTRTAKIVISILGVLLIIYAGINK